MVLMSIPRRSDTRMKRSDTKKIALTDPSSGTPSTKRDKSKMVTTLKMLKVK